MDFGSPLLRAWHNIRPPLPAPAISGTAEDMNTPRLAVLDETEAEVVVEPVGKRRLQCVSTKAQHLRVLKWMKEQVQSRGHDTHIISHAVRQFPEVFRGCRYQANLQKCGRWWANQDQMLAEFERDHLFLSNSYDMLQKRVELKAGPGRGRKTSEWCKWLYPLVQDEFERLRNAGVKFSPSVLLLMAKNVFLENTHPTFAPSTILPDSELPLIDRITPRWIQQFQDKQNIVHWTQSGKLIVSPKKTEQIERSTAYHMGVLHRGFTSGELQENLMENMDETYFIVNMDNKRTLGFWGDTEVKYADVVSGGLGISMVVKCTGGVHGKIGIPFLIFLNPTCSYPIRGTPDNVPGVAYRTSKKSFMTSDLLVEYYKEPRVNWADPSGRTKIQWVDNCPGHNLILDCRQALDRIKTQVRYFPANSTHLTQPCDSFVISKIKYSWRRRWDAKKMEMIKAKMWQGDGRAGTSGALKNPGWSYFLQLAAECVRDVNNQVDKAAEMSYARMAMIRCGLSLNSEGEWIVKQLSPELQEVIAKYKRNFDGFRDGLTGYSHEQLDVAIPRHISGVPSDGVAIVVQDSQLPEPVEEGVAPEGIEGVTLDSDVWGYFNSQYNA